MSGLTFKDIDSTIGPIFVQNGGNLELTNCAFTNIKSEVFDLNSVEAVFTNVKVSKVTCTGDSSVNTGYCLIRGKESLITATGTSFIDIYTEEDLFYYSSLANTPHTWTNSEISNVYSLSKSTKIFGFILFSGKVKFQNSKLTNWEISGFDATKSSKIVVQQSTFDFYPAGTSERRLLAEDSPTNVQYFYIMDSDVSILSSTIKSNGAYASNGGV
jgi:hypothetical protein